MADVVRDKASPSQELSPRDERLLDMLISGKSERAVAEAIGISQARVNQIRHTPAAVAYLLRNGGDTKAMLFSRAGAEILARLDWGGVKLTDLIAIWKAAMPQEVTLNTPDLRRDAELVAEELGLDADARARLIDYAAEKRQRRAS